MDAKNKIFIFCVFKVLQCNLLQGFDMLSVTNLTFSSEVDQNTYDGTTWGA